MGVENRRAASGTGSGGGTNPFNFKRPSREGESHSRKGGEEEEVELNVIWELPDMMSTSEGGGVMKSGHSK